MYPGINNGNINNKKVLLRERKRHTACRVASTPYVVLPGYPPPARVPPRPGYPPSQGTPPPGYPPGWTWQGTPQLDLAGYPPCQGTPPPGYPPRLDLAGYPPWLPHGILGNVAKHYGIWVPPPRCELTNKVKLLPSRRTTYAGGNKESYINVDQPLSPWTDVWIDGQCHTWGRCLESACNHFVWATEIFTFLGLWWRHLVTKTG